MKKLFVYLKGYGKECMLGPLFKLLEVIFELLVPLIVARIIDGGILTGNTPYIVRMVLVMALLDENDNILYMANAFLFEEIGVPAGGSIVLRDDISSFFMDYFAQKGIVPAKIDAIAYVEVYVE